MRLVLNIYFIKLPYFLLDTMFIFILYSFLTQFLFYNFYLYLMITFSYVGAEMFVLDLWKFVYAKSLCIGNNISEVGSCLCESFIKIIGNIPYTSSIRLLVILVNSSHAMGLNDC